MTHPLAAEAAQALQGAVWVVFDDAPNLGGAPAYVSRRDPRPLPDRFKAVQYVRAAALTALSAENAALAALVAELTRERDEAFESITNNNDWFSLSFNVWSWLLSQPDMPDLPELEVGEAEAAERNFQTAINALCKARALAAEAKVAELTRERVVALAERDVLAAFSDAAEAKVARFEGALRQFAAHYPRGINPFLDDAHSKARAALTEGDTNG